MGQVITYGNTGAGRTYLNTVTGATGATLDTQLNTIVSLGNTTAAYKYLAGILGFSQTQFNPLISPKASITVPRRALLIGDSITVNNSTIGPTYQQFGYFTYANQLMGQPFYLDVNLNKGVAGNTTAQMSARFQADVLNNLDNFDIAFIMGGTNDFGSGAILPAQTFANLQNMVLPLLAAGKWVVLYTVTPRTTNAYVAQINILLRQWAATFSPQSKFFLVDIYRYICDPTTGLYATGMSNDGTHPTSSACYYIGKKTAEVLSPYIPSLYPGTASILDAYNSTTTPNGQLLPNTGFGTLTGGTNTNTTGTCPLSYTLSKAAGSFTSGMVVGSSGTNAAGYGAVGGNKFVITAALTSGLTNAEDILLQARTANGTSVPGSVVYAACRLDLSNITNLYTASLSIYDFNSTPSTLQTSVDGSNNINNMFNTADQTLWLKTPRIVLSGASSFMTVYLHLILKADVATASVTASVSEFGLFQVSP